MLVGVRALVHESQLFEAREVDVWGVSANADRALTLEKASGIGVMSTNRRLLEAWVLAHYQIVDVCAVPCESQLFETGSEGRVDVDASADLASILKDAGGIRVLSTRLITVEWMLVLTWH